jgi:hypothetical protein
MWILITCFSIYIYIPHRHCTCTGKVGPLLVLLTYQDGETSPRDGEDMHSARGGCIMILGAPHPIGEERHNVVL